MPNSNRNNEKEWLPVRKITGSRAEETKNPEAEAVRKIPSERFELPFLASKARVIDQTTPRGCGTK